jgi:outer membrane protein assembly factor BamA
VHAQSILGNATQNKADSAENITVRKILLTGNKKTKTYVIQREYTFEDGKQYNKKELDDRIELARQQIINTSLFVDVSITKVVVGPNQVDILILVKERIYLIPVPFFKPVARNLNEWIHTYKASFDRVNYGIKLAENNVTGRNDKLNVFLSTGYAQNISFSYSAPYLDKKLRHGLSFGFGYSRTRDVNYATDHDTLQSVKEPDFARKTLVGTLGYTYRKGSHDKQTVLLSYTNDQITDSIGKLNPNFFGGNQLSQSFIDLSYDYQLNYVDIRSYPLTGWLLDVSVLKRFSKNLNMLAFGGKALESWKIWPRSNTYFTVQAAGLIKFPADQPYYNSHLMGYGDLQMKGLEYYVIDGSAGGYVRGMLRQKVFGFNLNTHLNSRTYHSVPFNFYLKTYSDIGYVYNKYAAITQSMLNNKLLHTGGFGLDIVTIYDLAFKIEYSFNQLGGHGFFLHTSADF